MPYLPDPVRSHVVVSEEDKARAAENPPHAVPFHCKPWVDAAVLGWTLFYGYLTPITITGTENNGFDVTNRIQLNQEGRFNVIDIAARGYFSLFTGYYLQTPPGYVSLFLPSTEPPPGLEMVSAVVETDWWPRELFLIFRMPALGEQIQLDYQTQLGRVVVVPRHEDLTVETIADADFEKIRAFEEAYMNTWKSSPYRWETADGRIASHFYRFYSRQYRQQLRHGTDDVDKITLMPPPPRNSDPSS